MKTMRTIDALINCGGNVLFFGGSFYRTALIRRLNELGIDYVEQDDSVSFRETKVTFKEPKHENSGGEARSVYESTFPWPDRAQTKEDVVWLRPPR